MLIHFMLYVDDKGHSNVCCFDFSSRHQDIFDNGYMDLTLPIFNETALREAIQDKAPTETVTNAI